MNLIKSHVVKTCVVKRNINIFNNLPYEEHCFLNRVFWMSYTGSFLGTLAGQTWYYFISKKEENNNEIIIEK
jgi:hypothetical protein